MKKISLANLPTPIQKLERLSGDLGCNLYLKRDDYTGTEVSGNKIRKLEYAIADAIAQGADTLVTAGAIQSNHCRATAAAAKRCGLGCELVIRGEDPLQIEGNFFLDYMLGAMVHRLHPEESREDKMYEIETRLASEGKKAYRIPVGASNSVGSLGYAECFREIRQQELELGVEFDAIVLSVGSGGTYAGLWYGNEMEQAGKCIYGISVSDSEAEFKREIIRILRGMEGMTVADAYLNENIRINDQYIGRGYALSTREEIAFLLEVAEREGVIFDPCYTGKAFLGCIEEIRSGALSKFQNILFIHTGGLQGWTHEQRLMVLELMGVGL